MLQETLQRTICINRANRNSTMATVDQYINAATRDNTRKSYQSAIDHFEVQWGGFLPATADSVARYLADHAGILAINTLKQRLAALGQWHIDQGMPDPTKAPLVKKVLRGIRATHATQEKQARPLQLSELEQLDTWLSQQIAQAASQGNRRLLLKHRRDRALVLLGFWRAFRSDELSQLEINHIDLIRTEGMRIFLPRSKTDRNHQGKTYATPVLSRLCPVTAYQEWIDESGLTAGPVFRSINRWGQIGTAALHPISIIPLLRGLLLAANILDVERFSSHSLRRGFASWANASGWDLKTLMDYVGWKDTRSAMKYIDTPDPFLQDRINKELDSSTPKTLTIIPAEHHQ